jgi:hypothetical protein
MALGRCHSEAVDFSNSRMNLKENVMNTLKQKFLLFLVVYLMITVTVRAQVGGEITGFVKDPSRSAVAGATVFLANAQTGVKLTNTTAEDGGFTFPVLGVGQYQLEITANGFQPYRKSGLFIDIGSSLVVDVILQLEQQSQSVVVTEGEAQVETTDTQLGQVLGSTKVTEIPLNGRSYTDLFATQVGVTPLTTSGAGNSTSGGGFGTVPVAGATNTGQFSINGQREDANGFSLNGANVQEAIGEQAGIIPNLDSIAEFRILTSNTDAEYGNFSGGLINVVTKSGGNAFHGSAFEFLRNTDLDAKDYFSTERSTFQQNQYGGTFGGPIKRNKIFFFADYQGQDTKQGQDTGIVAVPSLAERVGDFSDAASTLTGTVNGPYLAQMLTGRLGYTVQAGEPFYTASCSSTTKCVFPNAIIPTSAFALPATKMLQYIPLSVLNDQPGGLLPGCPSLGNNRQKCR